MKSLRALVCVFLAMLTSSAMESVRADTPAPADPQAQALLSKVKAATDRVQTLTADITRIDGDGTTTEGLVRLMKPNFVSVVYRNPASGTVPLSIASDGKTLWRFPDKSKREYLSETASPTGAGFVDWLAGVPLQAFFGTAAALKAGGISAESLHYAGSRTGRGLARLVCERRENLFCPRHTATTLVTLSIAGSHIPQGNGWWGQYPQSNPCKPVGLAQNSLWLVKRQNRRKLALPFRCFDRSAPCLPGFYRRCCEYTATITPHVFYSLAKFAVLQTIPACY